MGAAENRAKSQAHAEYMKRMGVTRKTARCPLGCGGLFSVVRKNGLIEHFVNCAPRRPKGVRY